MYKASSGISGTKVRFDSYRRYMRISFSHYHPLDHLPFTAYCRSLPGGGWNHVNMAWYFHRREQVLRFLLKPWYKLLLCQMGKHREQVWHLSSRDDIGRYVVICWFCDFRRGARDDEYFEVPDFSNVEVVDKFDED